MLDLVMLIIGERQAETHLLEPGKRIFILATDVEAFAAQFDERHFLMLVLVIMVVTMVLVVVPVPATVQAAAVWMAAFIVMAVHRQAIFAALASVGDSNRAAAAHPGTATKTEHRTVGKES